MIDFPELEGTSYNIKAADELRRIAYEKSPELAGIAIQGVTAAKWWVDNKHMVIYKKWWKSLIQELEKEGMEQINFNYALIDLAEDDRRKYDRGGFPEDHYYDPDSEYSNMFGKF
jgi:hypothetical protein